jgi:glutaredoxin
MIVWSKENCPQCVQAKKLLDSKGITYEERKIGKDWTKEQLLESVPAARSVPQILDSDGQLIGGYNDLVEHLKQVNHVIF